MVEQTPIRVVPKHEIGWLSNTFVLSGRGFPLKTIRLVVFTCEL